jgi:RNA polymerase sigma-70 factor (ECF subfamily)
VLVSPDEFSRRFSEFVVPISRFVSRRIDRQDVDEIVNDVFAIAWRKNSAVAEGEELPWLYRIATNLISNHRRKNARSIRFFAQILAPDASPSAESIAIADIHLSRAWASLSPTLREVLALVAVDGLSVTEVAHVLAVTPNAVSVRLNRARAQLREALDKTS